MNAPSPAGARLPAPQEANALAVRAALLYGNFAIGCGVMVVAGSLNDLVRSLGVSVAMGGQLISVGAACLCFGAPLLAAAVAGWDRRRLLTAALLWFALGHALCALAPNFALLMPLRAAAVLAAAVFTPQAAAAIGHMTPPNQRGRAITTIFLGWSLSSVLGMPVHAYIGETFGWRWAYALVVLLSLSSAAWVWRVMPDGVKPPALSLASWREVFTHPVLMAFVAVTALFSAGQFTLFSYLAPFYREVLHADAGGISLLFMGFGAFGVLGNVFVTRHVDRIGPARANGIAVALMALSMLLWPLGVAAGSLAVMLAVTAPWALGCFSANSAQQARLSHTAPALAPALMALNTSAIYFGQAAGAASGGLLLGERGPGAYDALHWVGLVWLLAALALSAWAERRIARDPDHV
ncbi:MAG TPA: MFS transporter [Burkholderiaceae bacterium]|nr:MFS transporter [Burkholderiaceae bacterium]HMZ00010.1 MFS transporter [Burkholderiaceae bacterium]HNB43838.1 MFS transporter [Burkholderiaceae bacterium]HNG79901.1 MFS transporter [Burkholderiaceae bacterium]